MAGQTGINPLLAFLSPDQQQSYAQLQQKQAIGQALLQQGLQPMDAGQNAVGGVAYHVSPLNGVSKLLNTYLGNKLSMDASGQQAQLMSQMYGNAFGTNQPQQQPAPADPSQTPDAGGIAGGGSGVGVQSFPVATPGQPSPAQIGQQLMGGAQPAPGPLTIPGTTPQQSMMLMTMAPDAYSRGMSAAITPTDATRMAIAAGSDPRAANADALFHANYVPPNQGTPGTITRDPRTGQPMYYSPDIPKGGEPVFNAGGQVVGVRALDGSLQLIGQAAAAQAGGEGSQLPYAGVSSTGAPLPVTNRTAAANQSANQPPPIPTLPGLTGQGAAPGSNVPLPSGATPGGPIYAAPPMGSTSNADAAQGAGADTMKKSYTTLQAARSSAPAAIEALQAMQKLGANKSSVAVGALGTGLAASGLSAEAAEYEKQRANVIGLLAQQGGLNGSDQARGIVEGSVPDYGKPKDAINSGLQTLINQTRTQQLKADMLTPAYNAGDSKTYTTLENQFDQNIRPSMMPILQLSGDAQRAAVHSAIKANPSMRSNFEWAFTQGLLK
jgi:hypothetical protein